MQGRHTSINVQFSGTQECMIYFCGSNNFGDISKYHTCNQNITYLEYYFFSQNPKYNGFKNNCKIEIYFNQLVRNSMAVDLI